MIGLIASWLLTRRPGLGQEKATLISKILLGIVVLLIVVGGLFLTVHLIRGDAVKDYKQQVQAKTVEATATASDERVTDVKANIQSEQELHNVVNEAPKGTQLSAPAHALACERLRRVGRIPPACGPQGSGGDQAAAH